MSGVPVGCSRVSMSRCETHIRDHDQPVKLGIIHQLGGPSIGIGRCRKAIKAEFRTDLSHGDIEEIVVEPRIGIGLASVSVYKVLGVAGRVFDSLGQAEVNVLAIAQAPRSSTFHWPVGEDEIPLAVRTLHDESCPTPSGYRCGPARWLGPHAARLRVDRSGAHRADHRPSCSHV